MPLTHDHLVEWHGEEGRRPSIKGVAAFLDDKLIAVAGLFFMPGHVVAFCDLKDEARPFKKLIALTGARLIRDAKKRHKRIIAMINRNEPTAATWLTRLGFRQEDGDLWVCRV